MCRFTGNQGFEKHTKPIMDSFGISEYLIIEKSLILLLCIVISTNLIFMIARLNIYDLSLSRPDQYYKKKISPDSPFSTL